MPSDGSTITIFFDDGTAESRQAMAMVRVRNGAAVTTWATCVTIKAGHQIRMADGAWKSVLKLAE